MRVSLFVFTPSFYFFIACSPFRNVVARLGGGDDDVVRKNIESNNSLEQRQLLGECNQSGRIEDFGCDREIECLRTVVSPQGKEINFCEFLNPFDYNRVNALRAQSHPFQNTEVFQKVNGNENSYDAHATSRLPVNGGQVRFNAGEENDTHKRLILTPNQDNTNEFPDDGIIIGLFPASDDFPNGRLYTYYAMDGSSATIDYNYDGINDALLLEIEDNVVRLSSESGGKLREFSRTNNEDLYAQFFLYELTRPDTSFGGATMGAVIAP